MREKSANRANSGTKVGLYIVKAEVSGGWRQTLKLEKYTAYIL